ncbi:hypothetical protein [Hyalangium sp.]|uniref:hypothetical protein n=1 Tax=Hyalangium sp. TaxID=2028555 RepID=UPI002D4D5331|nr:hypothetical protein [Hyalangium sp.]HYH97196.1 hypothetical protein [Hyalangium sp.]
MKIESRKFAPAPRIAERPQPAPAAARNAGFVPAAKRPADGFESASPLAQRKGPGNVGGAGTKPGKPPLNMDFELDPSLEKHRELFAKVGARISKLPTEELQAKALERATKRLSEKLGQPAEKINTAAKASLMAAKGPGTTSTNDPQCYRADAMLNYSPNLKANGDALKSIGLTISQNAALKTKQQILTEARPQIDKLSLSGREKAVAERYVLALVKEDRALNGGFFGGGARPTAPHDNRFHILPHQER